jgi:hypothetical protein
VNRVMSRSVPMAAGVRQGCPLSPLLYLFVGLALWCWLHHNGVGIEVEGRLLTTTQFADDAEVLLPGVAAVGNFLGLMDVFAAASGQRLNPNKVELMWVGAEPPAPTPSQACEGGQPVPKRRRLTMQSADRDMQRVMQQARERAHAAAMDGADQMHGLRLVPVAAALGVRFSNSDDDMVNWQERLDGVRSCYSRLAGVPLSVFGRGFAASGYGISKMLYAAEFGGMPLLVAESVLQVTAKLVDRGLAPASVQRRATGVPRYLLPGPPRDGGFGVLPMHEHVSGRWAWWAAALAVSGGGGDAKEPVWLALARALLRRTHPDFRPLALLSAPRNAALGVFGGFGRLPGPCRTLSMLVQGLACLPRVSDVAEAPLEPGDWCWAAPLWGNPLLPAGPDFRDGGLEHEFWHVCQSRLLSTVGDLVRVVDMVDAAKRQGRPADVVFDALLPQHNGLLSSGVQRYMFGDLVDGLARRVPAAWLRAAFYVERRRNLVHGPHFDVDAVSVMLAQRLGWRVPGGDAIFVRSLSVRGATFLQLADLHRRRQAQHDAFLAEALGRAPTDEDRGQLRASLARLWRLRWENHNKEVFWRLTVDGVPIVGNSHMQVPPQPCPCGVPMGGSVRRHHFWACCAAVGVVDVVAAVVGQPLDVSSIWLVRAPNNMHQPVWDLVCLAVLGAMEDARRCLKVGARDNSGSGDVVAHAKARAVSGFWQRLSDFVAMHKAPQGWAEVPPGHPFVGCDTGVLRLNRPDA